VYIDESELDGIAQREISGLKPLSAYAHYTGDDKEAIRKKFKRVHECTLFRLIIEGEES
jgi:hypothetical protein